jgi:hypothetical protein
MKPGSGATGCEKRADSDTLFPALASLAGFCYFCSCMPFALLAILLGVAAPVPLAESLTSPEGEAILGGVRCGGPSSRRDFLPARPGVDPPIQCPNPQRNLAVPPRFTAEWTPRLSSRPPPFQAAR